MDLFADPDTQPVASNAPPHLLAVILPIIFGTIAIGLGFTYIVHTAYKRNLAEQAAKANRDSQNGIELSELPRAATPARALLTPSRGPGPYSLAPRSKASPYSSSAVQTLKTEPSGSIGSDGGFQGRRSADDDEDAWTDVDGREQSAVTGFNFGLGGNAWEEGGRNRGGTPGTL